MLGVRIGAAVKRLATAWDQYTGTKERRLEGFYGLSTGTPEVDFFCMDFFTVLRIFWHEF